MATKMGAIGFMRGLANDVGAYGITCKQSFLPSPTRPQQQACPKQRRNSSGASKQSSDWRNRKTLSAQSLSWRAKKLVSSPARRSSSTAGFTRSADRSEAAERYCG
jgi:hypothetical protein